jgi:hypothetical protein
MLETNPTNLCVINKSFQQKMAFFAGMFDLLGLHGLHGGADNDGLSPGFFGPLWWAVKHSVAAGFPLGDSPEEQQRKLSIQQCLVHLIDAMPCKGCRVSAQPFKQRILDLDFAQLTRRQAEKLVFDIHNDVNRKLGKAVLPESEFEKVRQFWSSGRVGLLQDGSDWTPHCGAVQIVIRPKQEVANQKSIVLSKKCTPTIPHKTTRT